ncbi:MAG: hypothetical protein V7719_08375 [Psychroserpens sp.]|uniref:hypothetical protein n=1 Tax=Psychroserpens sp. TaxID=2020870 RepID=UPI00300124CB
MYLPIDSNNSGFQLVHIDLKYGYGIACKFKFYTNAKDEEVFDITQFRRVMKSKTGMAFQAMEEIGPTTVGNQHDKYGYQMKVKLPPGDYDISDIRTECCNCAYVKKPAHQTEVKKENIIDIHIEESGNIDVSFEHESNDAGNFEVFTRHGTGVCLFYVI